MSNGDKSIIDDVNVFKERLVLARSKAGLSRKALAERVNISVDTLQTYTKSKASIPGLLIAARIANALDVSLDYLCGLDTSANPNALQQLDNIELNSILQRGLTRLNMIMHAGNDFCYKNNSNAKKLIDLLKSGVKVRVIINSPTALKIVIPHMSGINARYPENEETIIAWWDRVKDSQDNLEVRVCEIPFMHRMYYAEYKNRNIVTCQYYTFANDWNLINPWLSFDSRSKAEQCEMYRDEFKYLWSQSRPIDEELVRACEKALEEKRMR